jgi:membrane-bound metal-dependent hydrolase YbcI (DUF457 family)
VHVVTHFLAGWALAESTPLKPRDRAWVTWASVAPDLDGAGLFVDWGNKLLGRPETAYYETWHHALGHSGVAALLVAACAFAWSIDRVKTTLLVLVSFHLHLLMDILGSRGSSPIDIWPIPYLAPFAMQPAWSWSGQWPLTSWQNTTITVLLLLLALILAVKRGYSPLGLFSAKADAGFVGALRRRFGT